MVSWITGATRHDRRCSPRRFFDRTGRRHPSGAPPLADEAGAARRARRARPRPARPAAVGLRPRVVAIHAVVDHHLPHHPRPGTGRACRLPARAAADAAVRQTSRSRSTSRSTSRRCRRRSSVRWRPSRGQGELAFSASLVRRLVESAVEKCREIEGGRSVERQSVRRYGATLDGDCARGDRAVRGRPCISAACAFGAVRPVAGRRGRGALPHRSHARQCDGSEAAPIRPSPHTCRGSTRTRRR